MIHNRLLKIAVFFYVFSSVLIGKLDALYIQYIANVFLILTYIFYVLSGGKVWFPKWILFYGALAVYAFVGAFLWSHDWELSFLMSVRIFSIFLASISIINSLYTLNTKKIIEIAFIIALIINFLLFITQNFGLEIYINNRFVGTNENANVAGLISFITIYLAHNYFRKYETNNLNKIYLIFLIIGVILIVASGSRKALIIGIIYLLFTNLNLFLTKKRFLINLITLLLAIYLIYLFTAFEQLDILYSNALSRLDYLFIFLTENYIGDISIGERVYFIDKGLDIFYSNPIFGIGFDCIKLYLGKYTHNNFVELLSTGGIIGFLIYYSIHSITIVKYIKKRKYRNLKGNNKLSNHFLFFLLLISLDIGLVSYVARYYQIALVYSIYLTLYETE